MLDVKTKSNYCYNFVFKDGTKSLINNSDYEEVEVRIKPQEKHVKRIVIWYDDSNAYLRGFQFFDKDGVKLFESAHKTPFNDP